MRRIWVTAVVLLAAAGAGLYWGRDLVVRQALAPTHLRQGSGGQAPLASSNVEVVADNLTIPWEVGWLPSGEMLVVERPGRLLKMGTDRSVIEIAGVEHVGEGGLQGLAVHPRFAENGWIYLYLTTRTGGGLINRVERYVLSGDRLTAKKTIIDSIPGAQFHDGGRVDFGPDGMLYVTTGDANQPQLAQDTASLAGKILRVKDDSSIPADNPFSTAVYSYGHRNPQGLAWDSGGRLWATEHGRSGVQSGLDEINLIKRGQNYGWPDSEGDVVRSGSVGPVVHSGARITWAPAGAAIVGDQLFFGGLRGEALYTARLSGEHLSEVAALFEGEWGRLRAVRAGPDGWLYVTTSNRDGRGKPGERDDKVIRINPERL